MIGSGIRSPQLSPHRSESWLSLCATSIGPLNAIAERIFSGDEESPGAREARVVNYIDKLLAT